MIETSARAESLERKALAFEHASQPMALEDAATQTILECNLAFADWLGYGKDELSGLALSRLFRPQESGGVKAMTPESNRESGGACLQRKDGSLLPVRLEISDGDGQSTGLRIITLQESNDSARLAAAERRVAELEAQLQGVLDTVPVGLAIAGDASARHIRGNSFLEHMLGLPRGAEFSKTTEPERGYRVVRDGSPVPAEELPVQRACRGERVEGEQLEVVCEDGRRLFLLANAAPLHDEAGAITGAVGAFLDVSQRVAAESRLAVQHLRLEELVAERTRDLEHALAESARSRERFELAMRGANDGLWDWDMLTGEVYYSPRWKAMLGYGEDDLDPCFDTWERLVDSDGRRRALDLVAEIKAGRTDHFDIEFRMHHKQGHEVYVRSRAFVARTLDGRPVRMVGTHVDVTADKLHEQGLRASQEFARSILDSVPAELAVLDRSGQIRTVNEAWRRAHPPYQPGPGQGGEETRTCGKEDCLEVCLRGASIEGPCAAEAYAGICQVLSGACSAFTLEHPRQYPQGERWFLMSVTPLRGEEGGAVVSLTDITERKLAELALQTSENRLKLALKAARMGVWERNLRQERLIWSPECHEIFDASSFRGEFDGFERMIVPADAGRVAESVRRAVETGSDYSEEYRILRGDGELRWVVSMGRPEYDEQGQPLRVVGIVRDITERKQRELALRESEKRLRDIVDSMPGLVYIKDLEGRYLLLNRGCGDVLGIDPESGEGSKTEELFPPEVARELIANDRRVLLERRPRVVEECLPVAGGGLRTFLSVQFPLLDTDGRVYAICGISTDITERKKAEDRLRAMSLAVEQSPASVIITDLDARIQYVNRRFSEVTGYSLDEVVGCNPRILKSDLTPKHAYAEMWHNLRRGLPWRGELVNRKKDGRYCWEEVHISPLRNEAQVITHYVGIKLDVTARKQQEAALRESELKFSKVFHDNPLGMSISRMEDGRFLDVNDSLLRLFGLRRKEVIGHTSVELGMWDDPAQRRQIIATVKRTGRAHNVEAAFHRRNDPTQRTMLISFDILELGGEACLLGTSLEITERKALEQALRRESHKNEVLLRNASDGIFLMDSNARLVGVSDSTCAMLGYQREELNGMHLSQWDAEYDEEMLAFFHRCLANPARLQFERRHRRKGGGILDVEISVVPVTIDGESLLFCSARDISQRKQNEAALKASEARSRRQRQHLVDVIWGTNIGTWEWNVQTGATEFNERWAEICGYTLAELQPVSIATWTRLAHPEDLKRSEKLLELCFSGQSEYYECEARMRHKSGEWIWVLDRGRVVEWDEDGRPLRMSGTHQEISERKRAEEALMRKTRELRALLDTIPAPVFFKDQDMRHVEVNQAFCEFVGLPAECIIGCRNQDMFSEDVAASYDAGDQEVLQEGRVVLGEELEIADAWGRKGWYAIFKSPLYEDDGRIVGLVGLRVDITQRKQSEAERIALLERQRDTLIREVHHRIKNHLQGVIGLLRGHVTRNPETLALIEMVVNQVHAISQVYGLQSRTEGGVLALRRFLEDMVTQRPARLPVELSVAEGLTDANLNRESLVPLALVINELLTNAEKHLLPSGPPTVQARLDSRQGGVALRIFGSPARLPDDFDFLKGRGLGAGLDLVRSLLPEGVTLSFRDEGGGVVAELVLTGSALMPLKGEG
ncbi:PAS domain S-box protein [Methyloterricola oryzae]|uniref:PAS domain S-box protein n=1 Tax=Methyloterricola oryzae TaxID=1495050 RepID=UPI0005EB529A|nr:PAS domain S-box protein [Methyloterricola oryzae]